MISTQLAQGQETDLMNKMFTYKNKRNLISETRRESFRRPISWDDSTDDSHRERKFHLSRFSSAMVRWFGSEIIRPIIDERSRLRKETQSTLISLISWLYRAKWKHIFRFQTKQRISLQTHLIARSLKTTETEKIARTSSWVLVFTMSLPERKS